MRDVGAGDTEAHFFGWNPFCHLNRMIEFDQIDEL
jgi:hypothetical protein